MPSCDVMSAAEEFSTNNHNDTTPSDVDLEAHRLVHQTTNDEEEASALALLMVANVTHRESLLRASLYKWCTRAEAQSRKRRQMLLFAEQYYNHNIIYLFFRAWQWRFDNRRSIFAKAKASLEFAERNSKRAVYRAWHLIAQQRRQARINCSVMIAAREHEMRHTVWRRWTVWVARQSLSNACAVMSNQVHCELRIQSWRQYVHDKKRERILLGVVRLYTPSLWVTPSQTPLTGQNISFIKQLRIGDGEYHELSIRSTWLKWLKFTCTRRADRLHRYEDNVCLLQETVQQRVRQRCWQKWLLVTVSSNQERAIYTQRRRDVLQRWGMYTLQHQQARRHYERMMENVKTSLFYSWRSRASEKKRNVMREQQATEYYTTIVLSHATEFVWHTWKARYAHRQRCILLAKMSVECRQRLLQHLALRRVVDSVMHAAQPITRSVMRPAVHVMQHGTTLTGGNVPLTLKPPIPLLSTSQDARNSTTHTNKEDATTQKDIKVRRAPVSASAGRHISTQTVGDTSSSSSSSSTSDCVSENRYHKKHTRARHSVPTTVSSVPYQTAPSLHTNPAIPSQSIVYVPVYIPEGPKASDAGAIPARGSPSPSAIAEAINAYNRSVAAQSKPMTYGFDVHQHVDPTSMGTSGVAMHPSVPEVAASRLHHGRAYLSSPAPSIESRELFPPKAKTPVSTAAAAASHAPSALDWSVASQEQLHNEGRQLIAKLKALQSTAEGEADERDALQHELGILEAHVAEGVPLGSPETEVHVAQRLEAVRHRYAQLALRELQRRQLKAQVRQLAGAIEVTMDSSSIHE